jgi:hypothetical protein
MKRLFILISFILSSFAFSQILPPHQLETITYDMITPAYKRQPSSINAETTSLYPEEIFVTKKKIKPHAEIIPDEIPSNYDDPYSK